MTTSREDIEDEAAALWVARHMGGMIDATGFDTWLNGAPDRRARFDAMRAACMDDAVTQALEQSEQSQHKAAAPRVPVRLIATLGTVAAAIALFFAWPAIRFALTPEQVFATNQGRLRTFALADGSQVTLAGNSRVRARLAPDRREVTLEQGEAFFAVARDADRPFDVLADQGRATVLGTRFDVALVAAGTELAVEHGLVRFGPRAGGSDSLLVRAGYRTALYGGQLQALSATDASAVGAWRSGWIEAQDMPLSRLVAQLGAWSDRPIRIADRSLADKRVAGRFRLNDPARQLDMLAGVHGFACAGCRMHMS